MTPIDAAVLVLILALPLHWLVLRHFDRLADPAYLRRHGIVVQSERTGPRELFLDPGLVYVTD